MSHVDLESRIQKLELAVDAPVHLDKLKNEIAALHDPTIAKTLFYLDRYSSLINDDSRTSLADRGEIILGQSEVLLETSSALQSISSLSIPTLATSQQLIDILPDVRETYDLAAQQEVEIKALVRQSVQVMDEYYALIRQYNSACVDVAHDLQTASRRVNAVMREAS